MKRIPWKPYLAWVLLAEGVGALSGWLTRDGAKLYSQVIVQPPLSPPAPVFPAVWVILFSLMGVGAARVWLAPPSRDRSRGLALFGVQLAFNFGWSLIFFNGRAYGFALAWLAVLWALIVGMIVLFRRADRTAALLIYGEPAVLLALLLLLPRAMGLWGVWWAVPLSQLATALAGTALLLRTRRRGP